MNETQILIHCFIAGGCFTGLVCLGAYAVFLIAKDVCLEAKTKQDDKRMEELKRMRDQQEKEWAEKKLPFIEKWGERL